MSKSILSSLAKPLNSLSHLIRPNEFKEVHAAIYSDFLYQDNSRLFLRSKDAPMEISESYQYEEMSPQKVAQYLTTTRGSSYNLSEQKSGFLEERFSTSALKEFSKFLRQNIVQNLGQRNLVFYNLCLSNQPFVEQNRSLGFKYFPLLGEVAQKASSANDQAAQDLISSLDQGARLENLQKYFNAPWATKGFLRRMSSQQVPSLELVKLVGESLVRDLEVQLDGNFSADAAKEFAKRISKLPLNDERQIEAMWNIINLIKADPILSHKMLPSMILAIGDNWLQNERALNKALAKNSKLEHWKFYVDEIKEDLIIPIFLQEVQKQYQLANETMPKEALETQNINEYSNIYGKFLWRFRERISQHLTPAILEDKTEKMRKSATKVFAKRTILVDEVRNLGEMGLKARSERYPLFPEVEVEMDGYKIRSLVNKAELVEVGNKLGNCLTEDIRARTVHSGNLHFISIIAPDGQLYAGLIGRDLVFRDGPNSFKINKTDIEAPKEVTAEIKDCLKKLKESIGLNPKQGVIENDFTKSVMSKIGFDVLSSEQSAEIFAQYLEHNLLPTSLDCSSAEEFVEKLGLTAEVEKMAIEYKENLHKYLAPSAKIELPKLIEKSLSKGREI